KGGAPRAQRERRRGPFMPDWVLNCAVVSGCHSDRQPNHLTLSQLIPIMFCTCKRCIRTGVNDLSGLYSGASPHLRRGFPRRLSLPRNRSFRLTGREVEQDKEL